MDDINTIKEYLSSRDVSISMIGFALLRSSDLCQHIKREILEDSGITENFNHSERKFYWYRPHDIRLYGKPKAWSEIWLLPTNEDI